MSTTSLAFMSSSGWQEDFTQSTYCVCSHTQTHTQTDTDTHTPPTLIHSHPYTCIQVRVCVVCVAVNVLAYTAHPQNQHAHTHPYNRTRARTPFPAQYRQCRLTSPVHWANTHRHLHFGPAHGCPTPHNIRRKRTTAYKYCK